MKSIFGIAANSRRLLTLAALALILAPAMAETAKAELPPAELVKALQSGGYVVYMRHTKTEKGQEDLDHNNLANCATQRNLSEVGREQARVINKAFQKLGIRTGSVLTSPYCRAKETATIAFGGGQIEGVLRYLSHIPDAERPAAMERIVGFLGTAPQPGTNLMLVSHTENLKQTTGIWPKDSGVMHIFRPIGNGAYQHMGKINPGEWTQLARLDAPAEEAKSCIWFLCW